VPDADLHVKLACALGVTTSRLSPTLSTPVTPPTERATYAAVGGVLAGDDGNSRRPSVPRHRVISLPAGVTSAVSGGAAVVTAYHSDPVFAVALAGIGLLSMIISVVAARLQHREFDQTLSKGF
jgi:peptidoglycan/LPS O-acetylase OafA/YrhL